MEKELIDYDFKSQLLEERKEKIEKGGILKMIYDEAYFLKDKPEWLKDLFRKIDSFCISGIQEGVKNTFLDTYVRYNFNNMMFCKMKSRLECLLIYLKLRYSEIEDPPKWVRDYSKISRQTWVEIIIKREDLVNNEMILLDMTSDLIKKSFNRVIKQPSLSKITVERPERILPGFVTPTKFKLDLEISTDGFVQVGIRVHKSQLPKILEKLLE